MSRNSDIYIGIFTLPDCFLHDLENSSSRNPWLFSRSRVWPFLGFVGFSRIVSFLVSFPMQGSRTAFFFLPKTRFFKSIPDQRTHLIESRHLRECAAGHASSITSCMFHCKVFDVSRGVDFLFRFSLFCIFEKLFCAVFDAFSRAENTPKYPKNTPPTPSTDGQKIFLMHRHHDFSKNAFFAVWEERNGTETLRQIREKLRQIRETLRRIRPPNTIKNGSQGWKGVFPDFGWSAAAAGLKPLAAAHHLWVKESAFFN